MKFLPVILSALILCGTAFAAPKNAVEQAPAIQKKLIHFGWNAPMTKKEFLHSTRDLTETAPFDGIAFRPRIEITRDGKTYNYWMARPATGPDRIYRDDFKEWLPIFRKLQDTRLKHNFFLIGSTWFNANWFDDKDWDRIIENSKVVAWLARESGFKGISFDIEAYDFSGFPLAFHPEFGYSRQETAAQVRKRAAQWFRAITAEFPNMILHCPFWTSMCSSEPLARHPEMHCQPNYEFKIPFFNGIYDAAPDTVQILDGAEEQSYRAAVEADFAQIVADFYRFGPAWVAPENMAKYRKLTRLCIALYLDSYVPRENYGQYNLFTKTPNPTRMLFENVKHVLDYTDEYAWMWCERGTFWPKINARKHQLFWNDRLPNAVEAIEAAQNPAEAIRKFAGANLARNSRMEPGKATAPIVDDAVAGPVPHWDAWQQPGEPEGIIVAENGAVRFKNTGNAAIAQVHTGIKPGVTYFMTARAKMESNNLEPNINFYYRDSTGQGLWHLRKTAYFETPDVDGWKRAALVFTVPKGVDIANLTICVSVTGNTPEKTANDGGCLLDDFELREIESFWGK